MAPPRTQGDPLTHKRLRPADDRRKPAHRTAAAILISLSIAALCIAAIGADPMRPLRAFTRLSLDRRGARFVATGTARRQSSLNDCGATALADLLELTGFPVPTAASLTTLTATTAAGTTLNAIESAARTLGLELFALRWAPADLPLLPLPALAWVERRHFVVIAGRRQTDSIEIRDPAAGRYRMSNARFTALWSGAALVLRDSISPAAARASIGSAAPSPAGYAGTQPHNDGGVS